VNNEDVTSENHEGIVAKIKATPNEVHLLVADALSYEHFKRSDEHPTSESELYIEVIACHDKPLETGDLTSAISADSYHRHHHRRYYRHNGLTVVDVTVTAAYIQGKP